MDNAGKDGGRDQLHQDGQEDVRKAPFHGQFAPILPASAVFRAKKANQTTEMCVVSRRLCFGVLVLKSKIHIFLMSAIAIHGLF